MDNGEEKYQKGSFVFGCAISIEDKHCESFMIGECPGGATQIVIDMAESNARLIKCSCWRRQGKVHKNDAFAQGSHRIQDVQWRRCKTLILGGYNNGKKRINNSRKIQSGNRNGRNG